MTKHLPTSTWYCRHPKREVFDVGPYPSKDDAIEDGPADMQLEPGAEFEVGRMVPAVPMLKLEDLKGALLAVGVGHPAEEQSRKYLDAVHAAVAANGGALLSAVNLTLGGWLTHNDLWPNFGTMEEVSTHHAPMVTLQGLLSEARNESTPPPIAPEFELCPAHDCVLTKGHDGPHVPACRKPVPTGGACDLEQGHAGPCQFIAF